MAEVFGIDFSAQDKDQLVELLTRKPVPAGSGLAMVVTANIDHVVNLLRDAQFRTAYGTAKVATADGFPVAVYAKLRGVDLPGRVAGPDLFAAMMPALVPGRHRPFFVVSREGTGAKLRDYLVCRGFAPEDVGIVCPPFGFERDQAFSQALAWQVRAHGTTHLVMGVGSPKSELWLHEWRDDLGDCYAMGIGAGIDFFVGTEVRAPAWMQTIGMEWLWRLLREPRRLGRRYLVDGLLFPVAVLRDLSGRWQSAERRGSLAAGPADVHRTR
jgi:N-acetylglucosaminyldiphosphoundecaprenol N-acetyl-beta-D-mannosaminyltransferase